MITGPAGACGDGGGVGVVAVTVTVDVGGVVTGVILVVADMLCGPEATLVTNTVTTTNATSTAAAPSIGHEIARRSGGGGCQYGCVGSSITAPPPGKPGCRGRSED